MDSALKSLNDYLTTIVALRRTWDTSTVARRYVGMEDFVLQHGEWFQGMPLPDTFKPGPIKQCFMNSQEAALYSDLIYAEGFVLKPGLIPIHHGWCVNKEGKVIDLTLRDAGEGCAYIGVRFRTRYVRRMVMKHAMWGTLIDNYWARWPLLTGEHPVSAALVNAPPSPDDERSAVGDKPDQHHDDQDDQHDRNGGLDVLVHRNKNNQDHQQQNE